MRCTNINGCIGRGLTLSTATHFVHFAIRPTALTTHGVIAFWNSVYQRQHVVISLNDNGSLSVRKETTGTQIDAAGINISTTTVLGTTPAGLVTPNAWVHIGCAVKVHATTGTATVYINGAAVLTLSGQNTYNATSATTEVDEIVIGYFGGDVCDFDDFIISDDVAGDGRTTFLGDQLGEVVSVLADGSSTQWTRNTGATNASCVDDAVPDDDTTTVAAATVGFTDLYTLVSAPVRVTDPVSCLQLVTVAKKSEGGTRALAHVVRSAGTNYPQSDHYLGSTYVTQQTVVTKNPATSADWLVAAISALEIGQKVTV